MWQDGGEVMLYIPVRVCVCGQMGLSPYMSVCVFFTEECVLAVHTICSFVHLLFCMCVYAWDKSLPGCVIVYVKPCDAPSPSSDRHDSPRKK